MRIFISGGTGYIGRMVVARLVERGHSVTALCRPGSESGLPAGCSVVIGDALEASSFSRNVPECDSFVHLVGVAHPAPWKEKQFRAVDKKSLEASVTAAMRAAIPHFVYVSVAQPAPVMRAYQQVRRECEATLAQAGLNRTILRPWYVLGPGHLWPYALVPVYRTLELLPHTREAALRLGMVTLRQMTDALIWSTEHPVTGARVLDVPAIRSVQVRSAPNPNKDAVSYS